MTEAVAGIKEDVKGLKKKVDWNRKMILIGYGAVVVSAFVLNTFFGG